MQKWNGKQPDVRGWAARGDSGEGWRGGRAGSVHLSLRSTSTFHPECKAESAAKSLTGQCAVRCGCYLQAFKRNDDAFSKRAIHFKQAITTTSMPMPTLLSATTPHHPTTTAAINRLHCTSPLPSPSPSPPPHRHLQRNAGNPQVGEAGTEGREGREEVLGVRDVFGT